MTLLAQIENRRRRECEDARRLILEQMRAALRELVPNERILVFGSVLQPGRFREHSDVDIGVFCEPVSMSEYRLQGELEERLRRRVDVILLPDCRFADKIQQEGEIWTNED